MFVVATLPFYPNSLHSHVAGTVVAAKGDSVTVQVHGEQTTIAAAAMQQVTVSAGHGNRLKWAFVGALAGTAAGSVNADIIRRNTWHEKHYESENVCTAGGTCGEVFHLVDTPYPKGRYIAFTAIGTVTGALLGYALPGDRWRPLSVGAATAPGGGAGVQVALTLHR